MRNKVEKREWFLLFCIVILLTIVIYQVIPSEEITAKQIIFEDGMLIKDNFVYCIFEIPEDCKEFVAIEFIYITTNDIAARGQL